MSNTCGNCDCADKSSCGKKGSSYIFDVVETQMSYDVVVVDAPAAEHDGKCKCGSNCSCGSDCTCGH